MGSDVRPEPQTILVTAPRLSVAHDHQAGSMCLQGTRRSILATITTWLNSTNECPNTVEGQDPAKVLWLADISGSGKSTVAQHIAYEASQTNQLLCSFFFKRDIKARSSTIPVVAHLSRQLAEYSGSIRAEVSRADLADNSDYLKSFHTLITGPLCHHPPRKPSLIIIDALDESGPPVERADFLSALVQEVPRLPPSVKVMLTSKPSQDIDEALNRLCAISSDDDGFGCYRLTFDVYGQATRSDISKYITHSFQLIVHAKRLKGVPLPDAWPSSAQRTSLTGHANGLFLWVSIAAAYIDNSESPQRALDELLTLQHRPNPDAAMDALYGHILRVADLNPIFNLHIYRSLMEVALSVENPLTIQEMNYRIRMDAAPTLSCLQPVLHCIPEVRVVHNSFAEYVQDPHKCDPKFLITPRLMARTNPSEPGVSALSITPQQPYNNWYMDSSYLSTLYPDRPKAWELVPDVGSQIQAGSVSRYPITRGGFGNIWSARHIDGKEIAIKTLWLHGDLAAFNRQKLERRVIQELSVWRKLDHPNVLKLLGICVLDGEIGMVSELMPNGNVTQYILRHIKADKYKLTTEITAGLVYLHENGIIHGDLKGANVVITADGSARLMDFGLAKVAESTLKFSTTSTAKGTARWMAPELMNPVAQPKAVITFLSDIYSLGMTILEIYTGSPPFMEMQNEIQVILMVNRGGIPQRPTMYCAPQLTDPLWNLMKRCWARDSQSRPGADLVLAQLENAKFPLH